MSAPDPAGGHNDPRAAGADDADLEPTALDADTGKRRVYRAHLVQLCETMMGEEAEAFAFPGGSRRDSCRVTLADGRSVIATVRDEPDRAELEERVLDALARHGAPAPRIVAANRRLLLQEDKGDVRLSVAIHRAWKAGDARAVETLLDDALGSLARLHEAARAAGLAESVPLLGVANWWIEMLIDRPLALGSLLQLDVPAPEVEDLRDLLAVLDPQFVKWDARPANAVVDGAGAISWIDFEHSGARNPLDDLAWLLADEFVPHDVERDERLLARHVPRLGGSLPAPLLPHYARAMLVLHGTHRLNLLLNSATDRDGRGWRDPETCVRRDSVGAAKVFALRQCDRLAHHAAQSSLTAALAPFYRKCRKAIARLPGRR